MRDFEVDICFLLQSSPCIPLCLSISPAYQGKTSISTVGTSTSAYRLSLATMSRSNTGTGTVWEQDSEPSQQASQDTLSRTDEEDEESRSSQKIQRGSQLDHAREGSGMISALPIFLSSGTLFYKMNAN